MHLIILSFVPLGKNGFPCIAEMFLYLNGIACVLQLTIGMTSKRGRRLLPIWALDYRYIWFPLVTYFIFFLVPIVTIIISKYIEKKKRKEENGKNTIT